MRSLSHLAQSRSFHVSIACSDRDAVVQPRYTARWGCMAPLATLCRERFGMILLLPHAAAAALCCHRCGGPGTGARTCQLTRCPLSPPFPCVRKQGRADRKWFCVSEPGVRDVDDVITTAQLGNIQQVGRRGGGRRGGSGRVGGEKWNGLWGERDAWAHGSRQGGVLEPYQSWAADVGWGMCFGGSPRTCGPGFAEDGGVGVPGASAGERVGRETRPCLLDGVRWCGSAATPPFGPA